MTPPQKRQRLNTHGKAHLFWVWICFTCQQGLASAPLTDWQNTCIHHLEIPHNVVSQLDKWGSMIFMGLSTYVTDWDTAYSICFEYIWWCFFQSWNVLLQESRGRNMSSLFHDYAYLSTCKSLLFIPKPLDASDLVISVSRELRNIITRR